MWLFVERVNSIYRPGDPPMSRRQGRKTTGLSAGWQAEACPTLGMRFSRAEGPSQQAGRPIARRSAGRLSQI